MRSYRESVVNLFARNQPNSRPVELDLAGERHAQFLWRGSRGKPRKVTTSTTQESKRRPWWLLAVAILAVGGLVAATMAMTADDAGSSRSEGPSSGSIGDPEIRQAKWRFTVKRAPGEKLSKNQQESLPVQRKKLKTMAQDIFDALFLSPENEGKALRTNFTSSARKSYQQAGVGVPQGADDVRVRRRSAWIVIDQTARATMSVNVVARGQSDTGPFATMHRSVLYVAREKGGWKVFGYEVDQGPFKKGKASDQDDKANDKQSKSSEKSKKGKNKKKQSGDRNRGGDGS